MKRFLTLLLLTICIQSCQYFEKNVPSKNDLLNQEMQHINWSVVDEFPSTKICDLINNKEERKICFFNFLTQKVQEKLKSDFLQMYFTKIDTLNLKVTIDSNAKMTFKTNNLENFENFEKIDSIVAINLMNITPVEPGIKRGIKIKSEFILPIILN